MDAMSVDPPVRGESRGRGRVSRDGAGPAGGPGRDLDEASAVAARAFHHDPFFEFLEPNPVRRARGLGLFFRATVRALGTVGQITGARQADGRLMGVAAWVPPGAYPLSGAGAGRRAARRAFGPWSCGRPVCRDGDAVPDGHRPGPPRRNRCGICCCWSSTRWSSGPGSAPACRRPVLEAADREGVDCYLETQKRENLAYYRRFGYEVAEELRPVAGGPPLWTMRRQPGEAAS